MRPVLLSAYTMTSCLGRGLAPTAAAMRSRKSGLAPCRFETVQLDTYVGEIAGIDSERIPEGLARFDCRNNRAAEAGLRQDGFMEAVTAARERHGPQRVGVFMGTSTAGILQTELAYRRRDAADGSLPADFDYRRTHNTFSIAEFVRARLGLQGPCAAISTACSSSAKAFASAARLMEAGVIDAAVVGGVDTLCLTTLYGFNSLQLLSSQPCRPYDAGRDGISIGEAAAFFLLERPGADASGDAVALLGTGESCDAYHMSSPHPEGLGARIAMQDALASAGLEPGEIDYVNLHGTGTPSNDVAEDKAVHGLFGTSVPVSSTKGMTGHTLGAAGAVEAVLSVLAITEGHVPGSPGTRVLDPNLRSAYEAAGGPRAIARVLSNSFGFGGSNCSLVFGRLRDAA
ncbi:MAG TPA: beta-ketoacyl-[acyl-carrier-protein] synthase family protein [Usitatibacter sp.]|nr:beta-ketoacyl-[acyl-carrier-protein] synthase family protein [Usitatibacter sp.]